MDHLVSMHDLLDQIVGLQFVHATHIVVTSVVNFLETQELSLKIFEKFGEFLVVRSELIVPPLSFLLLDQAIVSLVVHILFVLLSALV